MKSSYKEKFDLSHRTSESQRILAKYPSHIPVIVDCDKSIGPLKKAKFLCPREVSVSHLLISVRKQIRIESNKAIFIFCENKLLGGTTMMHDLYDDCLNSRTDGDRFLYIYVSTENTFG
jgi:GABA(A) receptor-associated protein